MIAVKTASNATVLNGLFKSLSMMPSSNLARPASLVDWAASPELITIDQSAYLIGVDNATIREIVDAGGVDLVEQGAEMLVDVGSLREFWETYWELTHDATPQRND